MIKITIEIDGKPVELSMEAARKLHGELDQIFDKSPIWPTYQPQPYWYGPYTVTSGYVNINESGTVADTNYTITTN